MVSRARLRKTHQEDVKAKIAVSLIITRLQNHMLGKLKKPMDSTQIAAAKLLLDKVLSNAPTDVNIPGLGGMAEAIKAGRERVKNGKA